MSSYVQHQSPPAPLFAGCPRRPSPRSAPRGRMDLNLFREHQAAFRAEFRPPFPIGPLTWGGVFVKFPFPPRTPPQPRSPIGLNTMPDCAPILGNLKRKCIIFFIHVCSEPKFTGWGRHQTDPTASLPSCACRSIPVLPLIVRCLRTPPARSAPLG